MDGWIDNIKKNDDLFEFLKVLLTIIVFPLYLWYLSTSPIDYNDIKTICTLICLWILLSIVVFIYVINDTSVVYKLGTIGILLIPVIFCYFVYTNLKIDISFPYVCLYLFSCLGNQQQSINNTYSKIIHFVYIIPFFFGFLYIYGNLFFHNTLFNVLIIASWFIMFLSVLPYTQKLKEKEKDSSS